MHPKTGCAPRPAPLLAKIIFTSFLSNVSVQVQKYPIHSRPSSTSTFPPSAKRTMSSTRRQGDDEGYEEAGRSLAEEMMGTDGLPPSTGMEPGGGMSWDGGAVKSVQAGQWEQEQA